MSVTKGVIAAAGRGTRFLPVVKGYAKELVPVLNKPNIQYLVEEMLGAGITKIAIVHRPEENSIRNYFTQDKEWENYLKHNGKDGLLESLRLIWAKVTFSYLPQTADLPYGNASPLLAAKNFLGNTTFVYFFGDDFLLESSPGRYLKEMLAIYNQHRPAVVFGAQRVPPVEIARYASIKYRSHPLVPFQAEAVLEKLPSDQAPSCVAQFGRFVISPRIWPVLEKRELGKDNELWLADINNKLAQQDLVIAQPMTSGKWLTTGDPLRWLQTNLEVALKDPLLGPALTTYLHELNF